MKKIIVVLLGILVSMNVLANTQAGYTLINSTNGWKLWKKNIDSTNIYVQEIDVAKRQLDFVNETPTGKNGDLFPKFFVRDKFKTKNYLSLSNGAFFEDSNDPTGLSYGYKTVFKTYTNGWSTARDEKSLKMLVYTLIPTAPNVRTVKVEDYSKEDFNFSKNQYVLVGLSPYYNADNEKWGKRSKDKLGRTFIGVKNNTLYILNTDKMTQDNARLELFSSFGLYHENMIMFDGSSSTQLSFKEKNGNQTNFIGCRYDLNLICYRESDRKVPQAIAVY